MMMRAGRWEAALVVMLGAGLCARTARAYVVYRTEGGVPLSWRQTCIPITAYPGDLTDMPATQVLGAAMAAAAAWSAQQNPGTFLVLPVSSSAQPTPSAVLDGRNTLIFRRATWCNATVADDTSGCSYDPAALALTTVFANTKDGAILDADIEVNARYFTWTDLEIHPQDQTKQDLQNALAHEMGHFIGLDHPCYEPGNPGARPLDDLGNPAPDCDTAPSDIQDDTMFPTAESGQTSKRSLAPDDQLAVHDIYPSSQDPMLCPSAPGAEASSGCRIAVVPAGPGRWQSVATVAGLLVVLLAIRRRPARVGRRSQP